MPGPPPTPTDILEWRGSRRAKRRTGEPAPEKGAPGTPPDFTKEMVEIWYKLTEMLDTVGVITKIDGWQLERYCRYFARWRMCEKDLTNLLAAAGPAAAALQDNSRMIFKTLSAESNKLDLAMKQIEAQFGLTPAARARLAVPCSEGYMADGDDPDDEFCRIRE